MKIVNPLIYCTYRPREDRNLKLMLLNPTYKVVIANDHWKRLKKGDNGIKIPKNVEWFSTRSFNTPYGLFNIDDTYTPPFNEFGFNFQEFFKDRNMYLVFIQAIKENGYNQQVVHYPRLTWNNRKGFVKKRNTNEMDSGEFKS